MFAFPHFGYLAEMETVQQANPRRLNVFEWQRDQNITTTKALGLN